MVACLEEEVCNSQMVPFVQACSPQCDPSYCRQAMSQFYSALPHDVAESLVFCECEREDPECQQMKTSLHSGSCMSDESQMPLTCLDMLDSCAGDALCRQTFARYLFECFGAVEAPFSEHSTNDWLQRLWPQWVQCFTIHVLVMDCVIITSISAMSSNICSKTSPFLGAVSTAPGVQAKCSCKEQWHSQKRGYVCTKGKKGVQELKHNKPGQARRSADPPTKPAGTTFARLGDELRPTKTSKPV
ncbi:uncharacterized protein LOC127414309 [Myxocyprinus asiaticus]|uniref:uncharacterized protein LOC127414309 n=1 Tax=Myxocyprinus asiaticus TaxID=70543 RepID=UPI0022227E4D|nr:uncharacterized protein LOC127414309 [Myxocyprinus asiaticus]